MRYRGGVTGVLVADRARRDPVSSRDAYAGAAHSTRLVRLVELARASAEDALGAAALLANEYAGDALVLAQLTGECGLLGAFQRTGRSGLARELRGLCGGRSAFAGEGTCALFAVTRDADGWLGEPVPAARKLNRWVRGLLAGLTRIGVAASYPGRDFIAVEGARIAQLALAREASGAWMFQAILATGRPYTTAERAPEPPGLPPLPRAGALGLESEPLFAALASGFAERFGLALGREPLSTDELRALAAVELPALEDPELAGLRSGGTVAVPIGELEAHVALRPDGALARVRLRGDWIAAAGDVRALEATLEGLAPASPEVRARSARWLADPNVLALGVVSPDSIADAVRLSGG